MRVLRNACTNCQGTVRFYDDHVTCMECGRIEKFPKLSKKAAALLLSRVEDVDAIQLGRLTQAGKAFLKLPDLLKSLALLQRYGNDEQLGEEDELLLRKFGFIEYLGQRIE